MRKIWEVGSGQYDMYEAHCFCESEEQASRVSEAIGGRSYVSGPVTLFEAGDPLPKIVTVWSAWVDSGGVETQSDDVLDFEVRLEAAKWGPMGGRSHHQPTEEVAIALARAEAAR